MARTYAGILGPLALLTSLVHGMMHGGSTLSVVWTAWCATLVLSAVGYVLGWIAERLVEDAVQGRIAAELAVRRETKASSAGAGES